MAYSVQVIADSINPCGIRILTYQLKYPRFVHADLMTHRHFCLAGDSILHFDLPSGKNGRKPHRMRLDAFADKWFNGANRIGSKPKKDADLSWIRPDEVYTAAETATKLGFSKEDNINWACAKGHIPAHRGPNGRTWMIRGADIVTWRNSKPSENRFNMRTRLANMKIRQLNERTNQIQSSNVVNVYESGEKEVFEVRAGRYKVAGSKDHLIKTEVGWKSIKEITDQDRIFVQKCGKAEKNDANRFKKINGRWRSTWQNQVRKSMISEDPKCRQCQSVEGVDIHHIIPVHEAVDLAFDQDNVTLLCKDCHDDMHKKQGWQKNYLKRLYGHTVKVDEIVSRGIEKTYDLEIAGEFPNFLANDIVVHNSRNASSSRAIPTEKMIEWVEADPVIPIHWGGKKKGMQAGAEIAQKAFAEVLWRGALHSVLFFAKAMDKLGLHKQIVNRMLEPWGHINVVVTATSFDNFFTLRCHKDAQPEIQKLAVMMARARRESIPVMMNVDDWHLPYVHETERQSYPIETLKKISTARCCRVSYLTVDGKETTVDKDCDLHDMLLAEKHMSPFEHCARALQFPERSGNFVGWEQYRKTIDGEVYESFDEDILDLFENDYMV